MTSHNLAILAAIHYNPVLRLSSFSDNVTINTNTYLANKIIGAGRLTAEKGQPTRRMTLELDATNISHRTLFLNDHGPVKVELFWYYSNDGNTWSKVPREHVGVLSGMTVSEDRASIVIETLKGTIKATRQIMMTDAMQRELYTNPVPDRGFEYIERFRSEGVLEYPPPTNLP